MRGKYWLETGKTLAVKTTKGRKHSHRTARTSASKRVARSDSSHTSKS